MPSELKKCPFCGNKARIIKRKSKLWDIGCSFIDCTVWICGDKKCKSCVDGYILKSKAIESWNRRLSDAK